ncbi:cobW-domain-containing protein [Schizopora paradoxa]|uniref:CobW-domain-containing protein n=1 Tax=Schizopora paradoxa TaxID=27342 RepID=A0A0H2S6G1_9AGAM|nr:cobW-domain-containing protein [Schizopora paradoxa]
MDPDRKVPCTLISGFLGAGKSTLLKRILTERHGYRIAVIMNEFGDTAVSSSAKAINVSSTDNEAGELSEQFLELANGCLCCSIKDTGIAAIENLMKRKGAFDYILLETTGVADPGPIAAMFWHNEEYAMGLGNDIYLDGVVCVVDAVFGEQQMTEDATDDDIGTSQRQIACADVILLNKTDVPTEEQLTRVEILIQSCNSSAPVHRTVRGDIDLKHVIGINAYKGKSFEDLLHGLRLHDHDHDHDHGEEGHVHQHGPLYTSVTSIQVDVPVINEEKAQKLDEWIRSVLWEGILPGEGTPQNDGSKKLEVLRCKGVFCLESGEVNVLQGVRGMYEITPIRAAAEDDTVGVTEVGKLVFIGKGLGENMRKSLLDVLQ